MKIFYFSKSLFPSADPQTGKDMQLCNALADLKYGAVTLFAEKAIGISDQKIFKEYDASENFTVVFTHHAKNPFSFFLKLSGYNWKLQQLDYPDLIIANDLLAAMFLAPKSIPIMIQIESKLGFLEKYALKRLLQHNNFYGLLTSTQKQKDFLLNKFKPLKKSEAIILESQDYSKISKKIIEVYEAKRRHSKKNIHIDVKS